MRTIRKSGITALTAAIALSLGAVPVALTVPSILASGEEPTTLDAGAAYLGKMVLSTTSAAGRVSFNGSTETFTGGQQCEIMPAMDGDSSELLNITGNVGDGPGTAGFRDGSIGVFEFDAEGDGPQNASQCFRVDANSFTTLETVALKLDADLSDRFGRFYATKATATPVAQSRDGAMAVTLLGLDDSVETDDVTLPSPVTWSRAKSGQLIKDFPAVINALPEMGGKFYGIQLTATAGSFSLTGAEAATFDVESEADETFCSDGNATNPEGTNTITDDNTIVTYVGNAQTQGSTCFGVQLISGDTQVSFLKPLEVAPDAQFHLQTTWTVANNANGSPSVTLTDTLIDFEIPEPDEADSQPLDFCSTFPVEVLGEDTNGVLKILDWDAFVSTDPTNPFEDFDLDSENKEFACIDTRDEMTITESQVIYTDKIFVIGDLKVTPR